MSSLFSALMLALSVFSPQHVQAQTQAASAAQQPLQVRTQAQAQFPTDDDIKNGILTLTNADRAENGASALKENSLLDAAAQSKANDMLQKQYFAHVSPQGIVPWEWFKAEGYSYIYAGENLAMDFFDARSVEQAWMASPTHRANVINPKYREIGVGISRGTYKGEPVVFIAEFFGARR